MEKACIFIEPDGLYCRADRALVPEVAEALAYEKEIARPGQFSTKIKRQTAYFIDRRNGLFLFGLLDRVKKHLKARGIEYIIVGMEHKDVPSGIECRPLLEGIELREDQKELISMVRGQMRGVIVSPTGSGKTIMALGVISMWPHARSLILVHRLDILKQFEQRAQQYLPNHDLQVISGGGREPLKGQLVCATIQSISKYPTEDVLNKFDITICDECHHVCNRESRFGQFMQSNLAPVKIGFTATVPPERDRLLAMEGILGPVIGRLTIGQGQKLGIIAKPFVTLVPLPYDSEIGEIRNYREVYQRGVVESRVRNVRITKLALERASRGLTSLSVVKEVAHGEELARYADELGLSTIFINGATPGVMREEIKKQFNDKKVWNVICTDVWREGVDIPTLNCIIVAGAWKSALLTSQSIGRGMRTSPGKTRMEIIDFLDPYRILAQHAIFRFTVYAESGWLNLA